MATSPKTKLGVDDITNGRVLNNEWAGTGVFDKLVAAINDNIDLQYQKGRIKGADYANVYLGTMQSVLQSSIQYSMAEKESEVRIDLIKQQLLTEIETTANANKQGLLLDKDVLLKDEQIATSQKQLEILGVEKDLKLAQEAEVLSGTVRANADLSDKHLTTAKQRELLEEQLTSEAKKQVLLDTEEEAKQYEVDVLLADQHVTNLKQQIILDTEEQVKQYQVDTILPDEHTKNLKQQILLDTEEEAKQFEVDNILPEQLKSLYTERVAKDKAVAALGLDDVVKSSNTSPEAVYIPKYEV